MGRNNKIPLNWDYKIRKMFKKLSIIILSSFYQYKNYDNMLQGTCITDILEEKKNGNFPLFCSPVYVRPDKLSNLT